MSAPRYLNAAQVAERLGVTREWVYEHKLELGYSPLTDSARPRLRFDVRELDRLMERRARRETARRPGRPRKRRAKFTPVDVHLGMPQ